MVDRIRYPTVSYLPFYYVFFQFLLLTIFNLQANILTTKDILSNLVIHCSYNRFFKLTVGALRTDLSEFQGQNFKVGDTLGAELVCFYIQEGRVDISINEY